MCTNPTFNTNQSLNFIVLQDLEFQMIFESTISLNFQKNNPEFSLHGFYKNVQHLSLFLKVFEKLGDWISIGFSVPITKKTTFRSNFFPIKLV